MPTALHPRAQEIYDDAVDLGWKHREHHSDKKDSGVRLYSPVHPEVHLDLPPVRQWNEHRLRALQEKLIRYSDPIQVQRLAHKRELERQREQQRTTDRREREQEVLRAAEKRAEAASQPKPTEDAPVPTERHIIEEKPWLIRKGKRGGVMTVYPSHAVVQRTWSDGKIDFACVKGDYEHADPQSVTTHYARTGEDHPRREKIPDPVPSEAYQAFTPVRLHPHRGPLEEETQTGQEGPTDEELDDDTSSADPQAILAQVIALVAPDHSEEVGKLQSNVTELRELLTMAERERDDAASALQGAVERAEAAESSLRRFREVFRDLAGD